MRSARRHVPIDLTPVSQAMQPQPVCELGWFAAFWLWGGISGLFEVLGKRCLFRGGVLLSASGLWLWVIHKEALYSSAHFIDGETEV